MFYTDFEALADNEFDGLIVTGAPVEMLAFEDVDYWDELTRIFSWSRTHVRSTLYICWAAQAGLYYHYGIPKYPLPKKMFGIFRQHTLHAQLPIFRGFDDVFDMPHSRHTELWREDILRREELTLIAESAESGVSMIMARGGREFFITGHLEYAPTTLDEEYRRDLGKRTDVDMPRHYYKDDNPSNPPLVTWRAHANLLFELDQLLCLACKRFNRLNFWHLPRISNAALLPSIMVRMPSIWALLASARGLRQGIPSLTYTVSARMHTALRHEFM